MTPQLWKRNLSWPEWRQMHPDLDDREAEYLYMAELKMFRNYQNELLNQTKMRQARLSGDLLNLSADISTILTKGGFRRPSYHYRSNFVDGFDGFTTNRETNTIRYNQTNPLDNSGGWLKVTVVSGFSGAMDIRGPSSGWTGLPQTGNITLPPEFYGGYTLNNVTFDDSFLPGGKNAGWYVQLKYDIVIQSPGLSPAYFELYNGGIVNQYDPTDGGGVQIPSSGTSITLDLKQTIDSGILPLNAYGDGGDGSNDRLVINKTGLHYPNPVPSGTIFYLKNIEYNIWSYDPRS